MTSVVTITSPYADRAPAQQMGPQCRPAGASHGRRPQPVADLAIFRKRRAQAPADLGRQSALIHQVVTAKETVRVLAALALDSRNELSDLRLGMKDRPDVSDRVADLAAFIEELDTRRQQWEKSHASAEAQLLDLLAVCGSSPILGGRG